jgi:hypothetical protein
MSKREPTYRIDPIEPDQLGARFARLIDRLSPVLDPADVAEVRSLLAAGSLEAAYDRLDAITNEVTAPIETATLVDLVLVGQAVRSSGG